MTIETEKEYKQALLFIDRNFDIDKHSVISPWLDMVFEAVYEYEVIHYKIDE